MRSDWGKEDELKRDNHQTVSRVNAGLKKRGLLTWFDEDQMARSNCRAHSCWKSAVPLKE